MAGPVNPTTISWNHDGENTDGSNIVPEHFQGWEVQVNGQPAVAIPIGWQGQNGQYQAPVAALNLPQGDYNLQVRLVTTYGPSAWSNAVDFEVRKTPAPPFSLSVA